MKYLLFSWNVNSFLAISLLVFACNSLQALNPNTVHPPLQTMEEYSFKATQQGDLKLYLHFPKDWRKDIRFPAIVFFTGDWIRGDIEQFRSHCEYFSKRGMIAARAEYRLLSDPETTIVDCVQDGKSAIRWLRTHADTFKIDSNRIVAAGGYAGGYLSACSALVSGYDETNENLTVSSKPDALILFNPLLNITEAAFLERLPDPSISQAVSPLLQIHEKIPPTLLFCGKQDRLYSQTKEYFTKAFQHDSNAEFYVAENQGMGFFNHNPWRQQCLFHLDEFLIELGYIQKPPIITSNSKINLKKLTTSILSQATHDPTQTGRFTIRFTEHSPLTTIGELNKRFEFLAGLNAMNMNHGAHPYEIFEETFEVYVPKAYTPKTPYGLWVHISPSDHGGLPGDSLEPVLDRRKLIWIGANQSGNDHGVYDRRVPLALDAAYNMQTIYNIDPERVYVEGVSGGGRTASMTAFHHPEVWKGGIFVIGVNYWERMASPEEPGHYWSAGFNKPKQVSIQLAAREGRYVFLTGEHDSNRAQTKAYFENAYSKFLRHAVYIEVPDLGHRLPPLEWIEKALDFVDDE